MPFTNLLFWHFWSISVSFSCLFPAWNDSFVQICLSGVAKQDLVWEVLQKLTFYRCKGSVYFKVNVWCFLVTLGPIFMAFAALETGLNFDDFSWMPWGSAPGSSNTVVGGKFIAGFYMRSIYQYLLGVEKHKHCFEYWGWWTGCSLSTENERNSRHLISDQGDASQPGGPSKEALAAFCITLQGGSF